MRAPFTKLAKESTKLLSLICVEKREREREGGEKSEGNGEKFSGEENGLGFFLAKNREREV